MAEPAGILCRQEDILIVDRASHSVTAADNSGKVLQKIGREGSGAGEFRNPTAISEYGGNVYVLDGGNRRVQIFDENMDYVDEVGLKDVNLSDPNYVPGMLAVNASGVYIAGLSSERFVADRYDQDGREEIGNNFLGTICSYQEQIYLINSVVRTYDKKSDGYLRRRGRNWLNSAVCHRDYLSLILWQRTGESPVSAFRGILCSGLAGTENIRRRLQGLTGFRMRSSPRYP